VFFGVKLGGRVEQANDAGVDQIVQVDVHRQVCVNANGNGFHEWQMLQDDAVAARQTSILRSSAGFRVHGGVQPKRTIALPSIPIAFITSTCPD
jgi:hypothetical protein